MQIETQGFLPQIPEEQPEQVNITDVGIAVDVGTTTVAVKIWSLSSKKCLSVIAEKNLQFRYGCDIIRRISFATRPPLTGSSAVVETGESALHYAIISQLERMFAHALALAAQKTMRGIQLNVSKIVITGNTTMLSFVCAFPVEGLAAAPFTPVSHFGFTASWDKVRSGKINEKCSNLDLPTPEILQLFAASSVDSDTPVYFPPCVGAFIGADTVCAMLSAGFPSPESNENSCWDTPVQTPLLLADIGTNTEIALFIPKTEEQPAKILCTSAAAGPAFEAANISCGMSSVDGAIEKIEYKNGKLCCSVIGGGNAKGICGSGLVSAGSTFLKNNFIDKSGVIRKNVSKLGDGSVCIQLTPAVYLSQQDIRNLQLAKSAVYTGLHYMLERSPFVPLFCIAGGFGSHLDIEDSCAIGLIPDELKNCCVPLGNAALAGASAMLFSKALRKKAMEIKKHSIQINLAAVPEFQERYMNSIDFN